MSWGIIEASNGFNVQNHDSNSRFFARIRDDSVSLIHKYFGCEQSRVGAFNTDNTVNFIDIDRQGIHFFSQIKEPDACESEALEGSSSSEQNVEAAPAGLGKGLKQLAYLLLKTLKKKKTYSHKEVAEEIEQKLVRKNCQRNCEYKLVQKEKNIKRRIYDALNVMISVGLLEKEQSTIRVCNSWTCSEKNYALVDRRKEYEEILKQKASWIKRKKELLGAMRSKQNAIAEWLKANEEKDQETLPKLEFPLIFVIHPANQHPLIQFSPFHTTLTGRNMKILSETDLLEEYAPRESSPAASLTDLADPQCFLID